MLEVGFNIAYDCLTITCESSIEHETGAASVSTTAANVHRPGRYFALLVFAPVLAACGVRLFHKASSCCAADLPGSASLLVGMLLGLSNKLRDRLKLIRTIRG